MAELSTSLVEYIVEAGGRGFNPHHEKIFALARDLLEARVLLRESRREHVIHEMYPCITRYDMPCSCGADAWNARVDAVLADEASDVNRTFLW